MLSYHNDPTVKARYETRFARHRKLDQVIQGTGYDITSGRSRRSRRNTASNATTFWLSCAKAR